MASKALQELICLASSESGLCVSDMPPNTIARVTTRNSIYEVLVCSNHPRWPGPLRYNSGGHEEEVEPILIRLGKRLKLACPVEDRWFGTSAVQKVELVNDEKRAAEILSRKDNPEEGISEEEHRKQKIEEDVATLLPEGEREWAAEFLANFPHPSAYGPILSVMKTAQDAGCLSEAKEVLEVAYEEHWHYHHPDRRGRLITIKDVLRLSGVYQSLGLDPPGELKEALKQ